MENKFISGALIVIPQSAWQGFQDDLREVKEMLAAKSADELSKQWIESTEARKMLGVSQKTWQTYRDRRVIPFSQIGRKIYVRMADLQGFMESHYISAKK